MSEDGNVERQVVAERMTVGPIPKALADLADLVTLTGVSKASAINRAVTVYAFVARELALGNDLLIRDGETKEVERVHLI